MFLLVCVVKKSTAQNNNYIAYHQGIIEAEKKIFIEKNYEKGLKKYKSVFEGFEFVFVDDCVEAFQLALLYEDEEMALFFIKKAIANGLRIDMLNHLTCRCQHDFFEQMAKDGDIEKTVERQKVNIHIPFIEKYKSVLEEYTKSVFEEYISRIDEELLANVLERHIKEQAYKNCSLEMGLNKEKGKEEYLSITKDNLSFVKELFERGRYLGERNLGVMNYDVLSHYDIPFLRKGSGLLDSSILTSFHLSDSTYVPVQTESSVFEMNILYNILFHNKKSYDVLSQHAETAIALGYLHPREYASLQFSSHRTNPQEKDNLYLETYWENIPNTHSVNKKRAELFLPPYEIDFQKHKLSHQHCLQLSFGFFNGTR